MANGEDSRDAEQRGPHGRTQPEYSLGERMATMEAEARKDEHYVKVVAKLEEDLNDQKLDNVRTDMNTKDKARQEAITKAEKAATEAATALATEFRQSTENTQTRLGALERGGAGLSGEKLGGNDFERRLEQQQKAQAQRFTLYLAAATLIAYLAATGHIH